MRIKSTPTYERRVGQLLTHVEREVFEDVIAAAPERWPVMAGTGGVRKARVKVEGRGKSGGPRAIYFFHSLGSVIYMLTIYRKDEQDDLSDADKKEIKALVIEIKTIEDAALLAAKTPAEPLPKRKEGRRT